MYDIYVAGGSIGEARSSKDNLHVGGRTFRFYGTYSTKEEAKEKGKRYVNSFLLCPARHLPRYRLARVTGCLSESFCHPNFAPAARRD